MSYRKYLIVLGISGAFFALAPMALATATPTATTTYCVLVLANGCSDTSCVTVNVDIVCGEVYVPTAFSPNGDGQNDILYVRGKGVQSVHMSIYNRWGNKVFETNSMDNGWDGKYHGNALNSAVFVYYIEATFVNGQTVTDKGNVSIVK
mgnify:CR=1 FL=1